jgi:hypothetical protein
MPPILCPHCKCSSVYISEVTNAWQNRSDHILGCRKCGHRTYGTEKIRELQAKADAEHEALQARQKEEAAALESVKCAWRTCKNPHTPTSKYCSRTCSNKNAHAREAAREKAKLRPSPTLYQLGQAQPKQPW